MQQGLQQVQGAWKGALASVTDAVEIAKGSLETTVGTAKGAIEDLQQRGERRKLVPCIVCGFPTRGGDGGACADLDELTAPRKGSANPEQQQALPVAAATETPTAEKVGVEVASQYACRGERCRSCLTADERDLVVVAMKRLNSTLDDFLAGRPEERHLEPEETRSQFAQRMTAVALEATSEVLSFVPGVPVTAMRTAQVLHGVAKYGPLALYQTEVADALSLLAALSASSGVVPTGKDELPVAVVAAESPSGDKPRDCAGTTMQAVKEKQKAAGDISELSAGLYYLLVERRNVVGLDPCAAEREHARCRAVDLATLAEISEVFPLATAIAYSVHAADAQRQLRLVPGAWQLVRAEPAGPGGQPNFVLAVDRKARRAAVLIPGTQTPADLVTDLSAVPVRVPLGPGHGTGWVHRGMLRQACAVVRLVGNVVDRLERDGYSVFFAGHSLGAGIALLAGLAMRLGLEGPRSDRVRSFGFATPACANGVVGKFCEAHAVTVVNCDDIVPRLSIETARKLRADLDGKREQVRKYMDEDFKALQDMQNVTEKKRRNLPVDGALSSATKLEAGIPAPQDHALAPKRPPVRESPVVASPPKVALPLPPAAASMPSARVPPVKGRAAASRRRFMFCIGSSLPKEDVEEIVEEVEEVDEEGEETELVDVKLYPPGKLIHLYRHCGARRAFWINRKHPSMHRIEVMYGLVKDHSCDSYREGLEECLAFARGARPAVWKPIAEVSQCGCCDADFEWASILKSEPHRLQARNHCYACGDVVCDGCSKRRRPLPHLGVLREVRMCDRCFLRGGSAVS